MFHGKAGTHIRTAETMSGRSGQEGQSAFQVAVGGGLSALRNHGSAIFKHAQDGPVRDRAQRPLPVVIVHRTPQRNQLDGLEQRRQSDGHPQLRARPHADFLAQRREERRRAHFDAVRSWQQTRDGVEAMIVGEYLQRLGGRTEYFHRRTHLRRAASIANISRYRTRDCTGDSSGPSRKSHAHDDYAHDDYEEPELSEHLALHLLGSRQPLTPRQRSPSDPPSAWKGCRSL